MARRRRYEQRSDREYNGVKYRSKFEASCAALLTKQGIDFTYETIRLSYWKKVRGGVCRSCDSTDVYSKHTYVPDFVLDNSPVLIEVKGLFKADDRKKHLALRETAPHLEVRFWFQANRKLTKNRPKRYEDWAEEHGFSYHTGLTLPPKEWFYG